MKPCSPILAAFVALLLAAGVAIAPAQERPIVIGASISLSGAYSRTGEELKRGYELWQKDVNARGGLLGRQVEFKIYDDQSDPTTGVKLYERLVTADKVDLVMGPYSSPVTYAASTVTEKYRYPMVAAGASAQNIWQRGYKYIFQLYPQPPGLLRGMFEIAKQVGAKSIAVVTEDTAFSKELAQVAVKMAKEYGLNVVFYEEYGKGPADLSPQLLKAKAERPDILFGATYLPESVLITRQSKELDVNPKLYVFSIGPALPDYVENLGKDAEYALAMTNWEPVVKRPGSQEFAEKYRSAYGKLPGLHTAAGYSGGQILEAAVKKAGSLDHDKIRDALVTLEMETIWGPYKVDEKGQQLTKDAYFIQIQKGKREIVWPRAEATAQLIFPTPPWDKRR